MEKIELGKYQPSCFLAHDLINKLTIIIGNCDLVVEHNSEDAELLGRVRIIRDLADSLARKLAEHQCALDAALKASVAEKQAFGEPRPSSGARH